MGRSNPARKAANKEHWGEVLEGFAGQYELELERYGADELHWRLMGRDVIFDVWPTTGSYYIKDIKKGQADRMGETGKLPWDHNATCQLLYKLFNIPKEDRM